MKVKKAFTLVELLVVIAIIAVLMSVLMPALQKARMQATMAVCLGNQRTMSMAYALYTTDNDDYLVGFHNNPGTAPWTMPPMAEDGTQLTRGSTSSDGAGGDFATLDDRLRGIRAGKLWPYIEDTDAYHCPGDRRVKEGTYLGSSLVHRLYLTYTIQVGLNAAPWGVSRMTEINNPGTTFAFVEQYYDGWVTNHCDGFLLDPINLPGSWWHVIALWHGDTGTLGYVDGHAEKRKWVDERTLDLFLCRTQGYQPDNPDLQYLMQRITVKREFKNDKKWR